MCYGGAFLLGKNVVLLWTEEGTKIITVYTTWRSMFCMYLRIYIIGIAIRTLIIIEQS